MLSSTLPSSPPLESSFLCPSRTRVSVSIFEISNFRTTPPTDPPYGLTFFRSFLHIATSCNIGPSIARTRFGEEKEVEGVVIYIICDPDTPLSTLLFATPLPKLPELVNIEHIPGPFGSFLFPGRSCSVSPIKGRAGKKQNNKGRTIRRPDPHPHSTFSNKAPPEF